MNREQRKRREQEKTDHKPFAVFAPFAVKFITDTPFFVCGFRAFRG